MKLVASETSDMIALAQYLDLLKLCFLHIPNEGKRSKHTGAILKMMGLKKGAPDLLIFDSPPLDLGKKGTAIEFKKIGGKATKEQEEWLEKLNQRGWKAIICEGIDEAMKVIQELGYGKRRQ